MKRIASVMIGAALSFAGTFAHADDLKGADKFLCSAAVAGVCCDDGQCAGGTAQELGLPEFIEVDLGQKRVNTTKASGLNRTSPIDIVKRVEGKIVLQGLEDQRAWSFLIDEKTGGLSVAVAADGCNVAAFGSCTPMATSK